MPYKALVIAIIILAGLLFAWWDQTRTPSALKVPVEITRNMMDIPAPQVSFSTMTGESLALNDFRGKIIIVNFWATWCAPCVAEFPSLLALAQKNQDTMVLVALSVDEEPEKIMPFFEQFEDSTRATLRLSNVIIGHDRDKVISQDAFQTVMYPETYIIGPDMRIRAKIAGITDWAGDDMDRFLKSLLPERQNSEILKLKDQ